MRYVLALTLGAVCLSSLQAVAHHSLSIYDRSVSKTIEGTVREFEWTNPHSWIHLMVQDAAVGKPLEWSIEMASPAQQAQRGWKADTVKAGDKISVTIHPLKDGSRGGQYMSVVLPNGQTLSNPGRRAGAAE